MGYIVIIRWKSITDSFNEPMKTRTGHWTDWVYGIEGEFTKCLLDGLRDALTEFHLHYLFVYLFHYVTTVYFAYRDRHDGQSHPQLPAYLRSGGAYYLFFNVEVIMDSRNGCVALP